MTDAPKEAVRMTGVSKEFGGVKALEDVDLSVKFGEIHALLGENGAGKSTILKILSGVQPPSSGTVEIEGHPVTTFTPQAARAAGVTMIFQEMSLIPTLTVAQNIFLTREMTAGGLIDDRAAAARARSLFGELNVDIDPEALVADLGAGQRQLTEIAKAASQRPRVLILDEPTTAGATASPSSTSRTGWTRSSASPTEPPSCGTVASCGRRRFRT
jgi:ribose transport system ATP-binding protein